MTDKVKKYRTKHKRCNYCMHLKHVCPPIGYGGYDECEAKDCSINFPFKVTRKFCKCFELKEMIK
jgi:hypothetical protein